MRWPIACWSQQNQRLDRSFSITVQQIARVLQFSIARHCWKRLRLHTHGVSANLTRHNCVYHSQLVKPEGKRSWAIDRRRFDLDLEFPGRTVVRLKYKSCARSINACSESHSFQLPPANINYCFELGDSIGSRVISAHQLLDPNCDMQSKTPGRPRKAIRKVTQRPEVA